MKTNSAFVVLFGLFLGALYLLYFLSPAEVFKDPDFRRLSFSELKNWDDDAHDLALTSFQISCERLIKYPDDRDYGGFGVAKDWKPVCDAAIALKEADAIQAKKFFEDNFSPLAFTTHEDGLFTGYYAPLYKGSKTKSATYNAPLYAIPKDLQAIRLGDFDQRLEGSSIVGEVRDGKFVPYKDRKDIDLGALDDQNLELVWLERAEDTFFLQIQGSGFIELDTGEVMHLGYAQRNGRPYRAIGQYLIESGDVSRGDMSLQAILNWMEENSDKSDELMWKNPSYVFFIERKGDKPVGSLNVGLTPGRSLAVDRSIIPLGMPLWLETYQEVETDKENIERRSHLNRLVVAQDTGGAIKGKIRGDVYWGIGPKAELKAGPMKDRGLYYLLVPTPLVETLTLPKKVAS